MVTNYLKNLISAKLLLNSDRERALVLIGRSICLAPCRAEAFYLLSAYCVHAGDSHRAKTAFAIARELEG